MHNPTSSLDPTRLLRVGFLVGSPKIGGAERQVWHLARGVREAGHHATVLFMERKGRRTELASIDFSGVPHVYLGAGRGRGWLARWRLRRHSANLDVLVAFNLDALELAVDALRDDSRMVCVGSIRGLGFTQEGRLGQRLRRACSRAHLITCNSAAIERALVDHGICAESTVRLLPNIIPTRERGEPHSAERFRVLFVGNLLPVKQPELFVRACAAAIREYPSLRVTIAGDGPLRSAMERAAGASVDAFTFLGHVPPEQVPYLDADVCVSSSIREGSSNALLEAMSFGCAVVATRAGGNVDLVDASGAGLLVPVDGEAELTAALLHLAANPQLRHELGLKGRAYVADHHDRSAITRQLLDILADTPVGVTNG